MRTTFIAAFIIYILFSGAYAINYAYVLKFSTNEADQLVRFDADKDEIIRKIDAPENSGWNNFLVDEKGGCFIASFRKDIIYGRDIYYYDPKIDTVEHFVNLGDMFGPSDMALTENELIVHVKGHSGDMDQSDGVIFIDRRSKKIDAEIYIPKGKNSQADISGMYYDEGKYLVLTSFSMPPRNENIDIWLQSEKTGDIYVVDIEEKKLKKTINIPRQYKSINGVNRSGNKIYAAALYKGQRNNLGECPVNHEISVFSLKSGAYIGSIEVDGFPLSLVRDRSLNKLYVLHRNERMSHSSIEVIATASDKVIDTITIPNQLMASIVAPHKMYVSAGNAQFENRDIPSKLYVIDTRIDKIIKEFEGVYTGISINPKY